MNVLNRMLEKVGLLPSAEVSVGPEATAYRWQSSYAELLVVDGRSKTAGELNELLTRVDAIVARTLREARANGRAVDAHVCIVADPKSLASNELKTEGESSRFVSRKYWLDSSKPLDEMLERLTLAWIELDTGGGSSTQTNTPDNLLALRKKIAELKGAGAANAFLEELDA